MSFERSGRQRAIALLWLTAMVMLVVALNPPSASGAHGTFAVGDIFLGVSESQVQWRHSDASLNAILTASSGAGSTVRGFGFDAAGNLYAVEFNAGAISVFDPSGALSGTFGNTDCNPESISFDAAGNVYVGHAGCEKDILKFNSVGTLIDSFDVPVGPRGSDWIDLAADQCTMFYTSEGPGIYRYDLCADLPLPMFNVAPLPGQHAFALRILPDSRVLVADTQLIVLLDSAGNQVMTYDAPNEDIFYALAIHPDGTSFLSAGFISANVYEFDLASGILLGSFNANVARLTGLAVNGEPRAALIVTAEIPAVTDIVMPVVALTAVFVLLRRREARTTKK